MIKVASKLKNDDLHGILFLMRDSAVNKVMRPAVSAALTPAVAMIRRLSSVDTRTFYKAVGRKIVSYSKAVVGLAGIRTKMGRTVISRKGRVRDYSHFRNPSKYAHLVERTGAAPHLQVIRVRGRVISFIHPGMRPAHAITAGSAGVMQTMRGIYQDRVAERLKAVGRRAF